MSSKTVAYVAALALAAAACSSDTSRTSATPERGPVEAANAPPLDFGPLEEDHRGAQAGPLTVTIMEPKGQLLDRRAAINVGFSAAVVDPKASDHPRVLQISPRVEGREVWLSPSLVSFVPKKPLPMGTKFEVRVAKGVAGRDGGALEEDVSFSFATTGLRVSAMEPYCGSGACIDRDTPIQISFNLPVKKADLANALTVTQWVPDAPGDWGSARPAPFELTALDAKGEPTTDKVGQRFRIKLQRYRRGMQVRVAIAAGMRGAEGPIGLEETWSGDLAAHGELEWQELECGWDICRPGTGWRFLFSNPMSGEALVECVDVEPALKLRPGYAYDGEVTLYPEGGAKPGTVYQVTVKKGCKDQTGGELKKSYTRRVSVEHHYPMVAMESGLRYMEPPEGGTGGYLPLKVRNTGEIAVRVGALDPKRVVELLGQEGGYWPGDACNEALPASTPIKRLPKPKMDVTKTHLLDLSAAIGDGQRGLVCVDVSAKDREGGDSHYDRSALVMVSDLALSAKLTPDGAMLWTTSLGSGAPVADATLEVHDRKGEVLATVKSDADGLASLTFPKTLPEGVKPVIVAKKGADLTVIDLASWSLEVDRWRFDLRYSWDPPKELVRGFVFSDRGVYRAGETAHVKAFVRRASDAGLDIPKGREIDLQITDPMGEVLLQQTRTLDEYGALHVDVPIDERAPMGTYRVELQPMEDPPEYGNWGYGSFRVEAYRPSRFEVKVGAKGAAKPDEALKVDIEGRYYFGSAMAKSKVTWYARTETSSFSPKGHPGYVFADRGDDYWWDEEAGRETGSTAEGTGELGADGTLQIEVEPKLVLAGKDVVVEADVEDVDGQVLSGRARITVHPGDVYVGVADEEWLIEAGKTLTQKVVVVTPEGASVKGRPVTVELVRRRWRSVKKALAGGGYTWVSEAETKVVTRCETVSGAQPASCDLEVPGSGSYLVRAKTGDKAVAARSVWAYGGGGGWWAMNDTEKVDLVADKSVYKVGDTARIMVQSPFETATALVSVEKHGVVERRVQSVSGSAPIIEVPVADKHLPNAFVSVLLIRGRVPAPEGLDPATDPGRPAARVGYLELKVDNADRKLEVAIASDAETYRPGDTVEAKVSLKDAEGQPIAGQVTFYAVDEGVLSLTGYRTPDPNVKMYAPVSLGVATYESRKAVLARVSPGDDESLKGEFGGGGGEGEVNYRSAFATTAHYDPALKIGPSGSATVTFQLPDNLSTYRLMAVAVGEGNRFGKGERKIVVNKPLLVRPALPRFLSTGDEVELRAVVQNLGDKAAEVKVDSLVSGPVALEGAAAQTLTVPAGGKQTVRFKAKVGSPGEATVRFRVFDASTNKVGDAVEIPLPVRYPAVLRAVAGDHVVEDAAFARAVQIPDWVAEEAGELEVELSSSQLGKLLPGLRYLIRYPYGCVEQTTGTTLPLVMLRGMVEDLEIAELPGGKIKTFAQAGVDRLLSMQTWEGGLGYWPGASQAHPWGSAYGSLALAHAVAAEDLEVPQERLERLTDYLRKVARGEAQAPRYWSDRADLGARAMALYALAVSGNAEPSYHDERFREHEQLSISGRALLLLAIAEHEASLKAPRAENAQMMEALARALEQDVVLSGPSARMSDLERDRVTFGSEARDMALVLMALMKVEGHEATSDQLAKGLLDMRRRGRWMSTQENAFAVMALAEYFTKHEQVPAEFEAIVRLGDEIIGRETFEGRGIKTRSLRVPMAKLFGAKGKALSVERVGEGRLYLTHTLRWAPKEPLEGGEDSGFTLRREYLAMDGTPIQALKPGQLVQVKLTMVVPEERFYVAVDDPLPSGLEPVNTAFDTTNSALKKREGSGEEDEDDWWAWYNPPTFDHVEQRDDRVLLFADQIQRGVYSHTYLARATTPGTFAAPGARIQDMYRPEIYGRSDARTLVVQ